MYPSLDPAGLPPPDCRIEARSADGKHFIIRQGDIDFYAIARGRDRPLLEFKVWDTPVGFVGEDVVVANDETVPNTLQRVDLSTGSRRNIANLPSSNLIFENGEGSPGDAGYAKPHQLFVISFSGAFRVARSMVYLSAFRPNGRLHWQLETLLPDGEGLITGESTSMRLFDGGRYAAVSRTSDRSKTEIVEVVTGRRIGSVAGWLIDGAADAPRLLLSAGDNHIYLVELSLKPSK